jgi:antitoxin (DNA-binding transcriptional repressor) of toxin-antitoxin stability system
MAANPNSGSAPPRRIGVRELRDNLTGFLRQVQHGASFIVTSHDKIVAELRPPQPPQADRRMPGTLRGRIHIAPDFDTLPADVLAAMEGEEM